MSSVRPLAYLTLRSVANGVKRATTSPKRLIGLAVTLLYYWSVFLRPFSPRTAAPRMPVGAPALSMPPTSTLDAFVFAAVGGLSLLLMLSVLAPKGGFKAADVDVLFPTPVSPRAVLLFRIARDTLATLLLPLFVALVGYRGVSPGLQALFRNYPARGGDILRASVLAYLLVSLVWVAIGYAASLFVNRSDLRSDAYRKRIAWGMGLALVGLAVYVAVHVRAAPSFATFLALAHDPIVRVALAPVTLATWFVMGMFQGQLPTALAGLAGLAVLIGVALRVALTQVGWMYDQAAVRGFEAGPNLRELQRKGDTMGMLAARARQGKLRHGRIASRIARLRVRGPVALLWKEAILQARGSLSGLIFTGAVFLGTTGLTMWAISSAGPSRRHPGMNASLAGWTLLALQGFITYMLCMVNSQGGFTELLRRVDVQKPLPFTPATTVFWEVAAKAVAPTILSPVCGLVGVAFVPAAWRSALTGAFLTPSLAIVVTAVVLLVIVLFPDVDDPTQRMFRGLMMMLGLAICVVPGVGVLLGGQLGLGLSPLLVAPVVMAMNVGIAVGLCTVAGGLYAGYNPNE